MTVVAAGSDTGNVAWVPAAWAAAAAAAAAVFFWNASRLRWGTFCSSLLTSKTGDDVTTMVETVAGVVGMMVSC